MVKNLPANEGDRYNRLPRQEDPLEEGMATHSSILAWKIPWSTRGGTLRRTWIKSVCVWSLEPGSRSGPGGSLAWVPFCPEAPQVLGSWNGGCCSCIRSVPSSKAPAGSPAFLPISLTGWEGLPGGKKPPPALAWVWPGRQCLDSPHELHIWVLLLFRPPAPNRSLRPSGQRACRILGRALPLLGAGGGRASWSPGVEIQSN